MNNPLNQVIQDQWTAVDNYFSDVLIPSDPILDAVLKTSDFAGLPSHNVAPNQGMLLQLLVQIQRAQSILEIGTLGGYSTIWMARGLPANGSLTTLEVNPSYAEVARANIERAGLAHVVKLRVGAALHLLPQLASENHPPFDLVFIDADKANNPAYFEWALRLSHCGTVIIIDNVVRNGSVVDAASTDESVMGVRRLNELIAAERRVNATAIQTVGSKGYDGFAIVVVVAD